MFLNSKCIYLIKVVLHAVGSRGTLSRYYVDYHNCGKHTNNDRRKSVLSGFEAT